MSQTTLTQITRHVYWMTPGDPDRPSLAAVVGTHRTLMIEGAASTAHARLFLDAIRAEGIPSPRYVAVTHWHWDHVFGAHEVDAALIAHTLTARQLAVLAQYDWSDAALDERVRTGEEIPFCADFIRVELPEPRTVQIALPDIVFNDRIELHLGDVTCIIQHVGGDHAEDSCVVYIPEDRVMFLSDCIYAAIYAPVRYYTDRILKVIDTLLSFDAQTYIIGHSDLAMSRAEFEAWAADVHLVSELSHHPDMDEAGMLAALEQAGRKVDEDLLDLVTQFIAGRAYR